MKPLTLTDRQKEKLLEMCNTLFPEVKWHFWTSEDDNEPDEFNETFVGYNCQYTIGKKKQPYKGGLMIHWFEFVMTHLAERILNPYPLAPNRGLRDKFKDFFWEANMYAFTLSLGVKPSIGLHGAHPVNYLYEQFKKLK